MNVEPEIYWWTERLIKHHGTIAKAFNAQTRHIGTEYGEMLQELQKLYGDNPRRPEPDASAAERVMDEMADIIITTLITMSLGFRTSDLNSEVTDSAVAALNRVKNRFIFVTRRLEMIDDAP